MSLSGGRQSANESHKKDGDESQRLLDAEEIVREQGENLIRHKVPSSGRCCMSRCFRVLCAIAMASVGVFRWAC